VEDHVTARKARLCANGWTVVLDVTHSVGWPTCALGDMRPLNGRASLAEGSAVHRIGQDLGGGRWANDWYRAFTTRAPNASAGEPRRVDATKIVEDRGRERRFRRRTCGGSRRV
jgi:hypothetical protein